MSVMSETPTEAPDVLTPGPAHDRATWVSAFIVRVAVGLLWMDNLSWKVPPDFGSKDDAGLYHFTKLAIEYPVFKPYSALVENLILPHFTFFAWGVYFVEISLTIFLILGLTTRFWALVGVGQTMAIFLSLGASPNEWKWSYFMMMAAQIAILGMAAGRVWGVDSVLRRRLSGRKHGRIAKLYLLAS